MWAIWLHWDKIIFKGSMTSTGGVVHWVVCIMLVQEGLMGWGGEDEDGSDCNWLTSNS